MFKFSNYYPPSYFALPFPKPLCILKREFRRTTAFILTHIYCEKKFECLCIHKKEIFYFRMKIKRNYCPYPNTCTSISWTYEKHKILGPIIFYCHICKIFCMYIFFTWIQSLYTRKECSKKWGAMRNKMMVLKGI